MPETKLSLSALREHLRKCWIFYIIGAAAIIFLNNLVFAVTRPVVPEEETVRVLLLDTAQEQEVLDSAAALLAEELTARGYPVALTEFENMVTVEDEYYDMMLIIKLTDGYSDLFVTDEKGFASLKEKGAFLPLDGIVDADDPRALFFAPANGSEAQIAGLRIEPADKELFPDGEVILVVSPATTNLEDALHAADALIDGGLKNP